MKFYDRNMESENQREKRVWAITFSRNQWSSIDVIKSKRACSCRRFKVDGHQLNSFYYSRHNLLGIPLAVERRRRASSVLAELSAVGIEPAWESFKLVGYAVY